MPRAVHLAKQLARALAGAHAQGVIHRDLKPDNVLVDADDHAFVSDFGIARSLGGAALTRTGMVVGTPNYLSPEQARGEEVDGRSDLYTLGIIFFEMLADALPFRGGSDSEVLAQRLVGSPSLERARRQGAAARCSPCCGGCSSATRRSATRRRPSCSPTSTGWRSRRRR